MVRAITISCLAFIAEAVGGVRPHDLLTYDDLA
jgi:hypothetical protein